MNFGVVGAGAIARRGHLPSILQIPGVEVACLADLDTDLARQVADEFGVTRCTSDYRDLLADPDVQVVAICTSTPSHFGIAWDALEAGKHVLVEKPMVMSLGEALRLYGKVKETGLKFGIVQNYRYMDAPAKARARVKGGFLGEVTTVHADSLSHFPVGWTSGRWLYHKHALLYDFTPHVVDMVLWCYDAPLERVYAVGKDWTGNFGFLNYCQILLEFVGGATATIDASWMSGVLRVFVDIRGTAGFIQFDPVKNIYSEVHGAVAPLQDLREFSQRMWRYWLKITGRSVGASSVYKQIYEDFIQCVRDDTAPPVPARDGLRVNLVLEAAQQSIAQETPVDVLVLLEENEVDGELALEIA